MKRNNYGKRDVNNYEVISKNWNTFEENLKLYLCYNNPRNAWANNKITWKGSVQVGRISWYLGKPDHVKKFNKIWKKKSKFKHISKI